MLKQGWVAHAHLLKHEQCSTFRGMGCMRGSVAREGKAESTSAVMQRTNPTLKRLLAVFEFPSFAK